jgi:hypothetical protein
MGTLSAAPIGAPQRGQRERGLTTDWRSGRRWMQTLEKLPTTSPTASASQGHRAGNGSSNPLSGIHHEGRARHRWWIFPPVPGRVKVGRGA